MQISERPSSCHFATKELLRPILDIVKTFISWKVSGTTKAQFSEIAKSCIEFGTNANGHNLDLLPLYCFPANRLLAALDHPRVRKRSGTEEPGS